MIILYHKFLWEYSQINNICKPDPAIYLYAAQQLGVHPKNCVAFEDSIPGITAAKAAGMFCIGINTGKDRQALAQADHIIDHYDELIIENLL